MVEKECNTERSFQSELFDKSNSVKFEIPITNKNKLMILIFFKYEENFRIWLAMNVLQPLVQMIDSCIDALTAVAPELKVGSVGVDKLKKAAQNISGIKQLNYVSYYFHFIKLLNIGKS